MVDGVLDVERSAHGYRWTFSTAGGAMYLGGKWHKTRKAALADGKAWQESR